jgi:hypothetical protein
MKIKPITITEKYEPRDTEFSGYWEDDRWRFKIYKVTHKKNPKADEKTLNIAKEFARKCIGEFNMADYYGYGYLILHKGMDCNMIIVNIWAGENMITRFSLLSSLDDPYNYKDVTSTGMNVCVWDESIHYFERNSWVSHILLKPENPDPDAYMNETYKMK